MHKKNPNINSCFPTPPNMSPTYIFTGIWSFSCTMERVLGQMCVSSPREQKKGGRGSFLSNLKQWERTQQCPCLVSFLNSNRLNPPGCFTSSCLTSRCQVHGLSVPGDIPHSALLSDPSYAGHLMVAEDVPVSQPLLLCKHLSFLIPSAPGEGKTPSFVITQPDLEVYPVLVTICGVVPSWWDRTTRTW